MAEAFLYKMAGERALPIRAESAGTVAGAEINPVARQVMDEISISMAGQTPKMLTQAMADSAGKVITMGCGVDAAVCPTRIHLSEDWGLDDPKGRSIEEIRTIRDLIAAKVEALLTQMSVNP